MQTRFLLTILLITMLSAVYSQDYNPFKSIGKKGKIVTAYGDRFVEVFDYDSIQRIGSVMFNIRTKKIVKLLNADTTFKKRSDNSSVSRWYSIDRKSESFYNVSPYTFVENNPIRFNDPNGDSLVPAGSATALTSFNGIVNTGLGGFYTVGQTSTGKYILNSTGQNGTMNSQQQEFYTTINDAATNPKDVKFNIVDGNDASSKQIIMGDCACYPGSPVQQHTIDVGDASKLGNSGTIKAQGIIDHEIKEGTQIQTQSLTTGSQISQAHNNAINSENMVNAGIRIPNPNGDITVSGNKSTLTLNVMTGMTVIPGPSIIAIPNVKTVTITFTNKNITKVAGN